MQIYVTRLLSVKIKFTGLCNLADQKENFSNWLVLFKEPHKKKLSVTF